MIEIYLKYDNMHVFGIINAFYCINNHVILCINSMLSTGRMREMAMGHGITNGRPQWRRPKAAMVQVGGRDGTS